MKRIAAILAGLTIAVALPGVGAAQNRPNSLGDDWRPQQDEARQGVRRGRMVPLSQVLAEINRRTPGRVLDAGIEYMGDRPVYRVRWITTDGRRIDYIVDASSGAILGGG
jgi:uncharacterized membrane protein YkoI